MVDYQGIRGGLGLSEGQLVRSVVEAVLDTEGSTLLVYVLLDKQNVPERVCSFCSLCAPLLLSSFRTRVVKVQACFSIAVN
jgi:hypothetical protein